MNLKADPLGYKLMSRQFSSARAADAEMAAVLRAGSDWMKAGVVALVLIAIGGALVLLHLARFVMVPVTAGIVIGFILGPIGDRARAQGVPRAVTFSALVVALVAALGILASMLLPVAQEVIGAMPRAAARLTHVAETLRGWTGSMATFSIAPPMGAQSASGVEIATNAVTIVSPVVSQFLIFLFTLILFLVTRQDMKSTIVMAFSSRATRLATLKTFAQIENRLTDYFVAITFVNLGLGVLVGATFLALGVKGAFAWAVVAFCLNFLPVVGPLVVKGALVLYGVVVDPTLAGIFVPLLAFLVINQIEANVVTPRIVGDRITMNPLLVFLSVAFWTWMWGFVGAFLAMPLLAVASAILSVREEPSRLPE